VTETEAKLLQGAIKMTISSMILKVLSHGHESVMVTFADEALLAELKKLPSSDDFVNRSWIVNK
jgi:hypothetical protein